MNNIKFDLTQYAHLEIFRNELLTVCKNGRMDDLHHCLNNPQAATFLWMREAPGLFGSNLCKEMIFDGFEFYEPNAVVLMFQALELCVAARTNNVFKHLWSLAGNFSRGQPQVDFLVHYFKNEDQQYVSANEKEIVFQALNDLKDWQREQLSVHSKVYNQPLFVELWTRSQQHILNTQIPKDKDKGVRKL